MRQRNAKAVAAAAAQEADRARLIGVSALGLIVLLSLVLLLTGGGG